MEVCGIILWAVLDASCGEWWWGVMDTSGHIVVDLQITSWRTKIVVAQHRPTPKRVEIHPCFWVPKYLVASWGHTHNVVAMSVACYGQVLWLHAVGIGGTVRWTSMGLMLWPHVDVRGHPLSWSHMDIRLDVHSVHVTRRIMLGHITGPRSVQVGASRQVC